MSVNTAARIIGGGILAAAGWVVLTPVPDPPAATAGVPSHADVPPVGARIMAKTAVARELLAGRLSPAEAAAVFGWLNRQPPALAAAEDDPCGAVIAWAEAVTNGVSAPRVRRASGLIRLPAVNEDACWELLNRAAAAASRGRGHPPGRVAIADLRLAE